MPSITKAQAKRIGLPKDSLQTIEIPRKTFTLSKAIHWLQQNGYDSTNHRMTVNFRRFMQVNPIKDATYYSKKLANGVVLVFQEY